MSLFLHVLDASDEDLPTLVVLGPFEQYVAFDALAVSADGREICTHDGVNPGFWVLDAPTEHRDGARGLVDHPFFTVRQQP